MAAAPPSTSPKAIADVQKTFYSLRQSTRTRDAISARRSGLGRAYRRRARPGEELAAHGLRFFGPVRQLCGGAGLAIGPRHDRAMGCAGRPARSEEHTSELQSLMRISYAVFCLKKKKKNKHAQL